MTDFWIQTYTGRKFSLSDPQPDDVCFEDVLFPLARQCRYTGHTLPFYSVAQHLDHVSRLVPFTEAGNGFGHDFAEAATGDISSPMKALLDDVLGPLWREKILRPIERVFAEAFGLQYPWSEHVKLADTKAMATEKRDLMCMEPQPWIEMPLPCKPAIRPWSIEESIWRFRKRYDELRGHGLIA